MIYRRAGQGDIPALVLLRLLYLEDDFGTLEDAQREALAKSLPGYFARHLKQDVTAFVCEDGGELVGCVLLQVIEKPASPAFPTGLVGTLLNVYTRPEYRRRGIAETLVKNAVDTAAKMGVSHVELKATAMGERLYEKLGFTHERLRHAPMRYGIVH